MIDKEMCLKEIDQLSAEEIWMHGTLEIYNGGIFPTSDTYCGLCWGKIRNDTPGERLFDWKYMLIELEELFEALEHYKTDKNHKDYKWLSSKLTYAKIHSRAILKEGLEYSELEVTCLSLIESGNRLEIPQDIFLNNYKELKAIMKNFEGKYIKNGFTFPYPAEQVLERIRNKETINLKKTYQFFGTPEALCNELCEMTFEICKSFRTTSWTRSYYKFYFKMV